jgi:hypoxanthine phosphoribosyltransferase
VTNEVINYSWQELNQDVDSLYTQINDDYWKPQVVVGLIRGGCIPGVMLSHKFGVPFEALHWSKRDFSNQGFGHFIEHICKHAIRNNERFLIVDDIIDSGETVSDLMHYATKMASVKYWNHYIKFATLWQNTDCSTQASFWAREIERSKDDRWVIFPWETTT